MIIKIKAFIYRFSIIFGLRIYLAKKEEQEYIDSINCDSELSESLSRGLWQGMNGFTSIWTYKMSLYEKVKARIKHAFKY